MKVQGFCPMGCGATLVLAEGGHITCSFLECPRPGAVDELLQNRETLHVVEFGPETFTVLHPLWERLDDLLLECQLHNYIKGLDGPPVKPGRYRAWQDKGRWHWKAVV